MLDDTGLTQVIEQPTRNDNVLDLIVTNFPNQVSRTEIIPGLSDHDIVHVEFNLTPQKLVQKPRTIPLFKNANWHTMKSHLNNV